MKSEEIKKNNSIKITQSNLNMDSRCSLNVGVNQFLQSNQRPI